MGDGPGPNHYFSATLQNRLGQKNNISWMVLVISVCINNHMSAELQGGFQPGHKSFG